MKNIVTNCLQCQRSFSYEKQKTACSYIRKYCDECLKIRKIQQGKNSKLLLTIRYGKDNGNYKGSIKLNCLMCNKEMQVIPARAKTAKYCSRKCFNLSKSEKYSGKNNPKWNGGTRFEYGGMFTKRLKEHIRQRDCKICQECGINEENHKNLYKQRLVIHHIDYNKLNNDERNLITLCVSCHNKICNKNKEEKREMFVKKINDIYNGGVQK